MPLFQRNPTTRVRCLHTLFFQRSKVIWNIIKAYLLERAIPGIFKYA